MQKKNPPSGGGASIILYCIYFMGGGEMIVEEISSMPVTPKMIETFHRLLAEIVTRHIEEKEAEQSTEDAG